MNYFISKRICDLYQRNNKNMNYSLNELLDNIESDSASAVMNLIDVVQIDTSEVLIDEQAVNKIERKITPYINDVMIEKLLIIAFMFPEV